MLLGAVTTPALDPILRAVSRSIYLTLQVAPGATRRQLGIGYLFCRAADTIADTRLITVEERIQVLEVFRAQFGAGASSGAAAEISRRVGQAQEIPEEAQLLRDLDRCFDALHSLEKADQDLLSRLVTTLTRGMQLDLSRFPPEESGGCEALASDQELDEYTYYVAGCVGELWTDLHALHLRALRSWDLDLARTRGVRFGKALQLTNILRDVDRDLALGRSYLPRPRLAAAGVEPLELRQGRSREKLRPVIHDLLRLALEHYAQGWAYTLSLPRRLVRLRLACAWPLLIGLRTLALLAQAPDPCAVGARIKVSRPEVSAILRRSIVRAWSNRRLDSLYRELRTPLDSVLST